MISPAEAARAVPDIAAEVRALPEPDQAHGYRHLLRANVHDIVMRWSVNGTNDDPQQLAPLAEAVRAHLPDGVEERLGVRVRVFVRLLRLDRYEPAWTLAHDNASGVVRPERQASLWAGGSNLTIALPVPTHADGGSVYAWLPGFRDPRWNVPDDVYTIDDKVLLRHQLDLAVLDGAVLRLHGSAYLGTLVATPEDKVSLLWDGPDGATHRTACIRGRRPELVTQAGPDATRLAWAGWQTDVPLKLFTAQAGTWRSRIEVAQRGLRRTGPLGRTRGPLADARYTDLPHRRGMHTVRLFAARRDGSLSLVVHPVRPVAETKQQVRNTIETVRRRRRSTT